MPDDYPRQLARTTSSLWPTDAPALPREESLARLLSTCYQASLLHEEGRPITFRLLLGEPGALPEQGGPPTGLQVLRFASARPFVASELRRLSPAAEFHRAMLGAGCDGKAVQLWGLVHTGPGWSREMLGGRTNHAPLPPWLVVHARAPGELSVFCGTEPLAMLRGGRIERNALDVFQSEWLPTHFADARAAVFDAHARARQAASEPWAELDPDFVRMLARHFVRRTVSLMQQRRHGGTILVLPARCNAILDEHLRVKYGFEDAGPRRRFQEVLVETMNSLARVGRSRSAPPGPVGWRTYSENHDTRLAELDESVFEVAHLFSDLASVDGALVLNQNFELLGFGAEISGNLTPVDTVWQAVDGDGEEVEAVATDTFGTRHRSVFRFCNAHSDVIAIVVSQDGQARFVKNLAGRVVYFDHRVLGAL